MSEKLTREQIEEWRDELADDYQSNRLAVKELTALCDLALSAADTEQRGRAAGLAEAVKVVDKICSDKSVTLPSNCTCRYYEHKGVICSEATARNVRVELRKAIRDLSPSPDHVLVPREPTPEMIDRGGREIAFKTQHFGGARTLAHYSSLAVEAENRAKAEYAYRAMIAEVK